MKGKYVGEQNIQSKLWGQQTATTTFTTFLAVLKVSNILGVLDSSEQIFPTKRSSGAPAVLFACVKLYTSAVSK